MVETSDEHRRAHRYPSPIAQLHEASARLLSQEELPKLLQEVIDGAIALTGADKGTLQLYDEQSGTLRIVAHRGFDRPFLDHFAVVHDGPAVCGEALRRRERVIVEDVAKSAIFAGTPTMAIMEAERVRAVQSTLMISRNERLLGMIATHWTRPHRPDADTLRALDLLARSAADLIEHRQHEQSLKESYDALLALKDQLAADLAAMTRLQGFSTRSVGQGSLQELLDDAIDVAIEISHADMGTIQVLDPSSGELTIMAQRGFEAPFLRFFARVTHSLGSCDEAMRLLNRVVVGDVMKSPIFAGTPALDVLLNAGVRALQSTPLVARSGALVGMLSTHYKERREPDDRALRFIDLLARQLADLIERAQAEASLAEAARRKDEFVAILGHELRNPLSPIMTALHLMKLRGGDAVENERLVIERQAKHLIRLVDDLLDVSRIARGKIELQKERIEMSELVAKAIEVAGPMIENGAHTLELDVRPDGLAVSVDPVRMTQAITNLLANAAKFTASGGRIVVSGSRDSSSVALRVEDNGIGITEDMLPKIFDLFTQERQPLDRSRGGLGLGLAIVRSLVELHGGTVFAESPGAGRGSAFTIRLPPAPPNGEAPPVRLAPAPGRAFEGRRVLIVDDNEDAALMLREMLAALGHEVRVAHDGPTALRMVDGFLPEVALLDIGLPIMDGFELAGLLRGHARLAGLRLIAVTGYGQAADRRRSAEAGFHAHVTKPVDVGVLDRMIRGLEAME